MNHVFQSQLIPYFKTGKFSKTVLDYIDQVAELKNFYTHDVNIEGIKSAVSSRKNFKTNRRLLVEQLNIQYQDKKDCLLVKDNVNALLSENTFTICTAHQPNIFTGHLYFIYKILHVIKISDSLKSQLPEYNFVPVFFMGSEDADFEELNHVVIEGEKYIWETKQTGAIGRMKVDDHLLQLVDKIAGRLSVEKYGDELVALLKYCFAKHNSIEEATFLFIHELFKEYGLIVFLPDSAAFKKEMISIFRDDIYNHTSSKIVNKTSGKLAQKYKAQAYPREINLFYLKDHIRNRIVSVDDHFVVHDTDLFFTEEEMENELTNHPERFSPNVILRGLFQEIILPDVAWVGGGGELAYWLQLKDLFENYAVPYPVLVVRNSFLMVGEKYKKLLEKLGFSEMDLFKGSQVLFDDLVNRDSKTQLNLTDEKVQILEIYQKIKGLVKNIDSTLEQYTSALETKHVKTLSNLEKKMFRAEKRKFETQKNQLNKIFSHLFPGDSLQERTENFMLFYAKWGKDFFKILYENSLTLEQKFCIISEEYRKEY